MVAAGLIFLFIYTENARVFVALEIGKMMRKEGKEEDRQQGSLVLSIGNIRGFAFFRGKDEGEKGERRWVRGGKEGKEEDLMRMNPKRP